MVGILCSSMGMFLEYIRFHMIYQTDKMENKGDSINSKK
jgi:hypothetical protein